MAFSLTKSLTGLSVRGEGRVAVARALPEEVPVAMVFDGATQAVMMASPGDIEDFALGFALSEGIVAARDEITEFEQVDHADGIEARMWLRDDRSRTLTERRRAIVGPVGCGLCGIDSLEQALRPLPRLPDGISRLTAAEVSGATEALRRAQPLHDQTRATHAAGLLLPGQGIVLVREDVGRHNALDKLIGGMARRGIDPTGGAVVMTSRLSVELVQKCAMAGCPVLVAVSAPTAQAQRLADQSGITLVAFARGDGFDLYSHPERILPGGSDVA